MKKWLCVICGLIYDEAEGWPDDGIAPRTRWEDVPEDWTCPDCGVGKEDFEMIEMAEDDAPVEAVAPPPVMPVVEVPALAVGTVVSGAAPVVIIGSGYAGYGLAEGIRKRSADTNIVLFTADDGANYSKPGLSNAMARGKTAPELVTATAAEMAEKLGITVYPHTPVESIDPQAHQLVSRQGSLTYSKLVLATGALPARFPMAGEGVEDILSVNCLTDYRVLREKLVAARKVCIIGNGLVGCEYANELINQGFEVSLVGLTRWPMDTLMPEVMGRDLQDKLSALGVNWCLDNTVQNVAKTGATYQLTLADGQVLDADLVLSATGLKPRIELAQAAGISCHRGIAVDTQLQTSAADVYALGDCVEIAGQVLPYIAPITHSLRALPDTLLGTATDAQYPLMPVVVKTPVLPLLLLPAKSGTQGEWQVEATENGMCGLFVDAAGKACGFALSGKRVATERQRCLDAVSGA